jgi:hypothetical protein
VGVEDEHKLYCDAFFMLEIKDTTVMTSTLPKGTLGSVASLLAATLYQGNPDRNHKRWNIVSSERYILHMQVMSTNYIVMPFLCLK